MKNSGIVTHKKNSTIGKPKRFAGLKARLRAFSALGILPLVLSIAFNPMLRAFGTLTVLSMISCDRDKPGEVKEKITKSDKFVAEVGQKINFGNMQFVLLHVLHTVTADTNYWTITFEAYDISGGGRSYIAPYLLAWRPLDPPEYEAVSINIGAKRYDVIFLAPVEEFKSAKIEIHEVEVTPSLSKGNPLAP